jgi:hypothetical protein
VSQDLPVRLGLAGQLNDYGSLLGGKHINAIVYASDVVSCFKIATGNTAEKYIDIDLESTPVPGGIIIFIKNNAPLFSI